MDLHVKRIVTDTIYNDIVDSIRAKGMEFGETLDNALTSAAHRLLFNKFVHQYIQMGGEYEQAYKAFSFVLGRYISRVGVHMVMGGGSDYTAIAKKEIVNSLGIFILEKYFNPFQIDY